MYVSPRRNFSLLGEEAQLTFSFRFLRRARALNAAALPAPVHLRIVKGAPISAAKAQRQLAEFLSQEVGAVAAAGGGATRSALQRLLEALKEEEKEVRPSHGQQDDAGGAEDDGKKKKRRQSTGAGEKSSSKRRKVKDEA